ncbi:MAG: O-antigen ligase family protein [Crocinitomicaceae bacterium]|nr:O-antigen ligase family protein [Crocinitomicaceae bacterium]
MLNRFFGNNTHTYLHILGISGIAFALPWSKVMMSISVMFVVLNLIVEANYKQYWEQFKSNRIFWFVVVIYALNVMGLLWSSNIDEAMHTIKQQLPFIAIPTVLVAKPISSKKYLDIVFMTFLAAMLITSLYNFLSYQHIIGDHFYNNIRGMSLTSSHIRYGLLISMAGAIALVCSEEKRKRIIPCMILLAWFAFYTYYSQVISGVISFGAVVVIYAIYHLWLKRKTLAIAFGVALLIIAILPLVWLFKPLTVDMAEYDSLPEVTAQGNPYEHNFTYIDSETNEPILIYLCSKELEEEWNKRSGIPFAGTTVEGNQVHHTLIRYLTSKQLPRDAEGVKELTEQDIRNIEMGRPSVHFNGLMPRMHALRFQLNYAESPNGHSLLQRFEYWKAGFSLATSNWLVGVGSGDVQDAFNHYYEASNSPLTEENRRRAHNQFLTYWISFGVIGLLLFVSLLFLFIRFNFQQKSILALLFIIIAISSFFMEDTLETQTGVTFFALFLGLFLVPTEKKSTVQTQD